MCYLWPRIEDCVGMQPSCNPEMTHRHCPCWWKCCCCCCCRCLKQESHHPTESGHPYPSGSWRAHQASTRHTHCWIEATNSHYCHPVSPLQVPDPPKLSSATGKSLLTTTANAAVLCVKIKWQQQWVWSEVTLKTSSLNSYCVESVVEVGDMLPPINTLLLTWTNPGLPAGQPWLRL